MAVEKKIELQFESDLQYQQEAIAAVVDVFRGQVANKSLFTVEMPVPPVQGMPINFDQQIGVGNKLDLLPSEVLNNLQEVQLRNGLPVTNDIATIDNKVNNLNLTVEMETGTGKTYVYLRTIFELKRNYGFNKFIIVVPSISIKEGVKKSLEITQAHFRNLYANEPYQFFVYDSNRITEVRDFVTSQQLRIMVINIQAFASEVSKDGTGRRLIFNSESDQAGGIPRELIANTCPIVIVDEPQTSLSTDLQKSAVQKLNPLVTLRYSATHREIINPVYKLDAVDAYQKNLVKGIQVKSILAHEVAASGPYIKLLQIPKTKNVPFAKLEVYVGNNTETPKSVDVFDGDHLQDFCFNSLYENYLVNEINRTPGQEYVAFSNGTILGIGESIGGIDDLTLKRQLIRETLSVHFDREIELLPKGIKVLSLFFIDVVSKYRHYDPEGNALNGVYANIFEEEYNSLRVLPKYRDLFNAQYYATSSAHSAHNGYFAISKVGKKSNTKEKYESYVDSKGNTAKDEDAYSLIMQDKERLLALTEPVRFIFSHSALREGWDNPNVFQICTLKEAGQSEITRRQEIGRGLRLAVDQTGIRRKEKYINTLTVLATESYETFAKNLQEEFEKDGIKIGYIEPNSFSHILVDVEPETGKAISIRPQQSREIIQSLLVQNLIDPKGKVSTQLAVALKENTLQLPAWVRETPHVQKQVLSVLEKATRKLNIAPHRELKRIAVNKRVYESPDFLALWDKIKYHTRYEVNFSTQDLIAKCQKELNELSPLSRGYFNISTGIIIVTTQGVEFEAANQAVTSAINSPVAVMPDILTSIIDETELKRSTVVAILQGLDTDAKNSLNRNPQRFTALAIKKINQCKAELLQEGIKYTKIGETAFYALELIEENELKGYLGVNTVAAIGNKSPYDYVVFDSDVEKRMAEAFEGHSNIRAYMKLPSWFKIQTPVGPYNPDWAVLYAESNGETKLFFVVETKGSDDITQLRQSESAKINFGKKHFKALENGTELLQASNINALFSQIVAMEG